MLHREGLAVGCSDHMDWGRGVILIRGIGGTMDHVILIAELGPLDHITSRV